jgi:D-alanine-D-alanine ligase
MLCRDKAACKRILGYHRIRVPRFQALRPGHTRLSAKVPYPVIVKPVYEDGSDGIALASLVHNANDLEERVRMIHERMQQPAICEEFIEGREVYVAIIGNKRLQTLPAREVLFGKADTGGPQFATSRVKLDDEYREKWGIEYAHADLPDRLEEKASYSAKRIYRLLHIRDYGRIDMRITAEGRIVFLEANPNPELTMGDEVAASAERVGIDHVKLIERIMKRAVARYKR